MVCLRNISVDTLHKGDIEDYYYYYCHNNNNEKKRRRRRKRMKEAERILKYKEITIKTQCVWSIKQSDVSNNRDSRNHLRLIQRVPD
jgi:hypothetical protein